MPTATAVLAVSAQVRHHHLEREDLRSAQRGTLVFVLVLNAGFMVAEAVGGFVFNSLALIADAGHTLSDVAALTVALLAHNLAEREPTRRHTYGFQRAEILGALANALILVVIGAWIAMEAIGRIRATEEVEGLGVVAIALIGLTINAGSAYLIARKRGHSLNMRGAYLHMLLDAVGSAGAVIAGAVIVVTGANVVDPVVSLVIVGFIGWSAWHLLSETVHVLLEGVPKHLDAAEVEACLLADDQVESVHHLHIWSLASDRPALSAHVILKDEMNLHDAQMHGDRLRTMLQDRFAIDHATLELECHPCD